MYQTVIVIIFKKRIYVSKTRLKPMLNAVSQEQSMNEFKTVKWAHTLKWEYAQPESKQETNTSP